MVITFAQFPFRTNMTINNKFKLVDFFVTPEIEVPDELGETLTTTLPSSFKKVEKENGIIKSNQIKELKKDENVSNIDEFEEIKKQLLLSLQEMTFDEIKELMAVEYPSIVIPKTIKNKSKLIEFISNKL